MARLPQSYGHLFDNVMVRMAYRCRAYSDVKQQQVLVRTFGCMRVVWNRTLAERRARWQRERKGTSYAQADAALTVMKKDPGMACRARHDRDINAAKNILAAGLAVTRGPPPSDACGAGVRHLETSPVRSAVKQEHRLATAGIPIR